MHQNRCANVEEAPEVEEGEFGINDIVGEEEMDFSITHRPVTHLNESFLFEDDGNMEDEEGAEAIPDVGSSLTKSTKRKLVPRSLFSLHLTTSSFTQSQLFSQQNFTYNPLENQGHKLFLIPCEYP